MRYDLFPKLQIFLPPSPFFSRLPPDRAHTQKKLSRESSPPSPHQPPVCSCATSLYPTPLELSRRSPLPPHPPPIVVSNSSVYIPPQPHLSLISSTGLPHTLPRCASHHHHPRNRNGLLLHKYTCLYPHTHADRETRRRTGALATSTCGHGYRSRASTSPRWRSGRSLPRYHYHCRLSLLHSRARR